MRDHPHFGGLPIQPAPVSGSLQLESALVCRQFKRGKNQEKEA
jgi:hypothetical protein